MTQSESVTHGVRVQVETQYVAERSRPDEGDWFFAYHITITNEGKETVQLLTRHWIITDANGRVQEVRGPGVVGKQPVLVPGQHFTYTSACPLETPFGTMQGSYQMVTAGGAPFDAQIPPFALGHPHSIN